MHLTIRANSVIQLCITYLRNFMQLVRIPAFAPYLWVCTRSNGPLQPVLLILTYLQHNKGWQNGNLGRHFVDEVIDFFLIADHQPTDNRQDHCDDPAPSIQQIPRAWGMLVSLRRRIDLPPHAERPVYKPAAPKRCELVAPAVAMRTMSLSVSENGDSTPTVSTSSRSQLSSSTVNSATIPSTEPSVSSGRQESESGIRGEAKTVNPFDIPDFEAWCSSLVQNPEPCVPPGHDEGMSDAPTSGFEINAGSYGFGEPIDYFNK